MARIPRLPHFVPCIAAAGLQALRDAAPQLADWQLRAPIDLSLDDAQALAQDYLNKLQYPHHLFPLPTYEAQDRVAVALGLPAFDDFELPATPAAAPASDLPFQLERPEDFDEQERQWQSLVGERLHHREPPPPPLPRASPARPDRAADWPELVSLDAWSRQSAPQRMAVAEALAQALGPGHRVQESAGTQQLPRVRAEAMDLDWVAVPGGEFDMGLSDAEAQVLQERLLAASPDSAGYVQHLLTLCRPLRRVQVRPFLCTQTPLLEPHGARLNIGGDAGNPHRVLRVDGDEALALTQRIGLRLLSEAEWEWIARAAGTRTWLSGDDEPATWAAATVATPLAALEHPLGILGLGWGEWVDDGAHRSYAGAPADSRSWEPMSELALSRSGALAVWPWQSGGELLLAQVAVREPCDHDARHALFLADELPGRPPSR